MQFAEDDVSAVASEKLGLCLLNSSHLIGITNDELASPKRTLLWIRSRNTAAFDCRMADTVAESEWFFLRW